MNKNRNSNIPFLHIIVTLRPSLEASTMLETTALSHTMSLGLESRQKCQIILGKTLLMAQLWLLLSWTENVDVSLAI